MTVYYPKGGKRSAGGHKGKHVKSETTGSPYFTRPMLRQSEDSRNAQQHNHYAKAGAKPRPVSSKGFPVSPGRTMRSPI